MASGQLPDPVSDPLGMSFLFDVTVSLSTGSATSPTGRYVVNGSPAGAAGHVTLVAAGSVAGDDFSISISGVFTPRPA